MVEVVRSDVGIEVPGEQKGSTQSPNKQEEAIESKASTLGWRPVDEFKGDPADWRPAKEFLDRQSLFDKIRSVKDENYHLKRDLETIKGYVERMSDIEYKKALRDLTAQRREAIKDAEPEKVEELDTQIDELKETRQTVKQEATTVHPAFVKWQEEQQWYGKDAELRREADSLGVGYSSTHKGAPPEEVLDYVTDRIKKMYPEKFGEQEVQTRRGPAVEGGGNRKVSTTSKKGTLAESDLDDTETRIMNALVKRKVLTKEKYLSDLAIAKGVN